MKFESNQFRALVDKLALALIGLICLGYFLMGRNFAEIHWKPSFLNFPVFIGEILLFVCFVFYFLKLASAKAKFNKWQVLFLAYLIFVLIKAFFGYIKWGPLAFRHAALFYYPLFAFFGYTFYKRSFFSMKNNISIFIIIIIALKIEMFFIYLLIPAFFVLFILIDACQGKKIRFLLFLIFLISLPYSYFIGSSRTMIVSSIVSIIFFIMCLFYITNFTKTQRYAIFGLLLCTLGSFCFFLSKDIGGKSLVDFRRTIDSYKRTESFISSKEKDFIRKVASQVSIFNPEVDPIEARAFIRKKKPPQKQDSSLDAPARTDRIGKVALNNEDTLSVLSDTLDDINYKSDLIQFQIEKLQSHLKIMHPPVVEVHTLRKRIEAEMKDMAFKLAELSKQSDPDPKEIEDIKMKIELLKIEAGDMFSKMEIVQYNRSEHLENIEYVNILFRIFIWRDMYRELMASGNLSGIDFGKPFLSKSIEILGWGRGEWGRDGWITAHNSFLAIIYRAGIFGVFFIISFFSVFISMVVQFLRLRSKKGLLMCSALVSWMIASLFLVILELPYNAIIFWSLFGMTFAYLKNKKEAAAEICPK